MMHKKHLLKLLLLLPGFLPLLATAQMQEGIITYEYRMDMHRRIPPEREDMKAMIPQFRTENHQLLFNAGERLYKPVDETAAMPQGRGGGGGRMTFRTPRIETYISLENNERTIAQEFMGRNYLIIDTLGLLPWRLGNEIMEILGHRCQMAWYTDTVSGEEITAWFTVGIQPFLGPDRYSTLPGTILALDINNGERVWVARKIEEKKLNGNEIRKPSRGEKISRPEFDEMMEQQMERMRSGGGFRF